MNSINSSPQFWPPPSYSYAPAPQQGYTQPALTYPPSQGYSNNSNNYSKYPPGSPLANPPSPYGNTFQAPYRTVSAYTGYNPNVGYNPTVYDSPVRHDGFLGYMAPQYIGQSPTPVYSLKELMLGRGDATLYPYPPSYNTPLPAYAPPQQSYAPQPSYAPQQSYAPQPSYAPQQSYAPQPSYPPQQSYAPQQSYVPQQQNYAPQQPQPQSFQYSGPRDASQNPIYTVPQTTTYSAPPQTYAPSPAPPQQSYAPQPQAQTAGVQYF